jgi:aldose 1-epimerase
VPAAEPRPTKHLYGRLDDGSPVHACEVRDGDAAFSVLDYGGIITRICPGHGWPDNVLLSLPTLEAYSRDDAYLGAMVGRFANRIANGRLPLDGQIHHLSQNENGHTLHGGARGFSMRRWTMTVMGERSVRLALLSEDGDQGFPGLLRASLTLSIERTLKGCDLRLVHEASTDRPTVYNPTFHGYFNLGSDADLDRHWLTVAADRLTPVDDEGIPTGGTEPVSSALDLRSGSCLREVIAETGGVDLNYVLQDRKGLRPAAELLHEPTGRRMEVWTRRPCLQVYTGGKLSGAHRPFSGIALETQSFPDGPNQPGFPDSILRPGEAFRSETVYRFLSPDNR